MGGEPIAGSTAGCTRQIWLDYKLTVALVIYWLTLLRRAPAAAEASTAEEVSKVHCCGHLSSQWPRLLACTVLMSHSRALCAVLCERARLAAPAAVALLRAFCCCCCFGSLVLPTAVTVTTSQASRRVFRSRDAELPLLYISCPGAGRLTDPVPRTKYGCIIVTRCQDDKRRTVYCS